MGGRRRVRDPAARPDLDEIHHPGPYGLRDPKIDEKRVLFACRIDRIATFGEP